MHAILAARDKDWVNQAKPPDACKLMEGTFSLVNILVRLDAGPRLAAQPAGSYGSYTQSGNLN
jgi:hypothetical protein